MVEDVFAAISAVENEVKKNADETMKQGFGLNKNITEILLGESNFYKFKISLLVGIGLKIRSSVLNPR